MQVFTGFERGLVVAQRPLGIARLAALPVEVADRSATTDRSRAAWALSGLRRVQVFTGFQRGLVVAQRPLGIARLAALQVKVAEIVLRDRKIARGLGAVGIARVQVFTASSARPRIAQRPHGIARLAALQVKVAELILRVRQIARGLGAVGIARVQVFAGLQRGLVVAQRPLGIARLAALQVKIAELVLRHRQIARGLGAVGIARVQIFTRLQRRLVVRQRPLGIARLAALQVEVAEPVLRYRQIARGLGAVGIARVQVFSVFSEAS